MLERLTNLKLRLKTLLRRNQLEKDLADEMAFHVAMREEKLREAGYRDPKFAAHRRFGNLTRIKEDCRDLWSFGTLERIWADVRIGSRFIRKNRWAMLAVVLSLSLGIGATASVFNLFDFFIFRSYPVPETNRVVLIAANSQERGVNYLMSNADYEDVRGRAQSFEGIVSVSPDQLPYVVTHPGQQGRNRLIVLVSANFFSALHVEPALGRSFRPEEDQVPGRDTVAVISHNLWQREYESRPDVIGKTIRVNSKDFTIVGVAPARFYGLDPVARPDVYVPRVMEGAFSSDTALTDRTARRVQVAGRLKDGISVEQARTEIERIGAGLELEHPDTNRGQRMMVYTQLGAKLAISPEAFLAAGVFFIVAGLVLGIACVNVANLLLSTAPMRRREMAIRVAMGASRGRLLRQMLIESVLVSLGGTLAGLVLASLCARFVRSVELFSNLPININVDIDFRVASFAAVVGVGAGVISGLIPAVRSSRANLSYLLKSEDAHTSGTGRMRIRRTLVVSQVAIAVVVLALSGFSLGELQLLRDADPGFRADHVLRVALSSIPHHEAFHRESLERLRVMPGVKAAAAAYPEPFGIGMESVNLLVDGYTLPPNQNSLPTMNAVVTDGYFDTLRIPILRGRAFSIHDMEENARVAIINDAMAKRYWPNRDPLGSYVKTIGASLADKQGVTLEIVGIARTAKYSSMSEEATPFIYLPMKRNYSGYGTLLVMTEGDPASFAAAVRRELSAVDPNPPIYDTGSMTQYVRRTALLVERLMAQVMTGVSVVGLLLSVLGLYGIIAYSVSQRTHEIGIRIAVGATSWNVERLILGEGLKLSLTGISVGLVASALVKSALDVYFRDTNSAGSNSYAALVYAAVIGVSAGVTLLACYLPARRASMVDPNEALRCDN